MITIKECKSKSDMRKFVSFPLKLYKNCQYYVPSIYEDEMVINNPKKNLSIAHSEVKCFLALEGKKVVGRIAGIINHDSNTKNNEKCIRFSRIDMIDDINVTEALLNAVKSWGKEKGMEIIQGPWGFDDSDREGMLTFGYDEFSSFATAYSYPYYYEHMVKLGYAKEAEWLEYRLDPANTDPRFPKVAEMLKNRGYVDVATKIKKPSKVVKIYGQKFFDCYNRSYADLDNFVKVEGKSMDAIIKTFATILNERYFSCIVDSKNDRVVAFGVGLPYIGDVLRKAKGKMLFAALGILKTIKKPKKIELALIAVDPDYRNSGVHALVATKLIQSAKEDNLDDIFLDPTLTTNAKMLNTWQGMGKTLRCKRQTFRKEIE